MKVQKKKVDERANVHRPDDSTPGEEAQTKGSMAHGVEPVKRVDPWLTLGLLRDDLKQIVALLQYSDDPGNVALAHRRALRALHRIGDGALNAEAWNK